MKTIIKSKEELNELISTEKRSKEVNKIVSDIKQYLFEYYPNFDVEVNYTPKHIEIRFKDYYQILADNDYDYIKTIAGEYFMEFYWSSSIQYIYINR